MSANYRSIAEYYHERTKYAPETIAAQSQGLDWETQPVPFKEYKWGRDYPLKPYLVERSRTVCAGESSRASLPQPGSEAFQTAWWERLSRLLFCSYGLTARIPTPTGEPAYLRAAPSAGGLYPAEIYLIARGTAPLPAGLYNYQPRTHSLLCFWDSSPWSDLRAACFWHPALDAVDLALVITSVFYRSAWRYQDRAYRRICLDTGHLLGNLELAAACNDWRPHLLTGFADDRLNQLLYLDPDQEGALAVILLADRLRVEQNLPITRTTQPSARHIPETDLPAGSLLAALHLASQIPADAADIRPWTQDITPPTDKYNFPFCTRLACQTQPIAWGEALEGLEHTLLKRRSTRAYTGGSLTYEQLIALLDFTYQPQHYVEQGLDGTPDYCDLQLIESFVVVTAIEGLESGCYYYAPQTQELRQIRFKNFRRELHYLCLGQELGRDAAAVVFHTADLQAAVDRYGDRAYRYLHLDAGHLGQRLNLAAIYLELGVSGIGGFFDDQVNEVLGIPVEEAVLYITTLGQPR